MKYKLTNFDTIIIFDEKYPNGYGVSESSIDSEYNYDEVLEYTKNNPKDEIKPTEQELLLQEKSELEQWLKEHDYIGTKIATNRATYEEYADVIAEMNIKANRINEIKLLLGA